MLKNIVMPLFSPLQGGLFITQAVDLIDSYHLRLPWVQYEGDLVLGPTLGSLNNYQILHLLTTAVSRLTGSSPYHVYNQDYWVRETVVSLYRGFRKSFLEGFPRLPDEKFIFLNDFLDRASENLVGHSLNIQCCTLTRKDSEFALGLGEMLLELQFPCVPRNGQIEVPSSNGDESQPGWLEDMAGQTRLLVESLHH